MYMYMGIDDINMNLEMHIGSHVAASGNWGSFKRGLGPRLKTVWVNIR